jgi:hypothetical protein
LVPREPETKVAVGATATPASLRGLRTRAMIAAMRRFAIAAALGLAACADSANAPSDGRNIDVIEPHSDGNVDVIEARSDGGSVDADVDAASDAHETQDDAPDPFQCASTASIVLSNPTITAGTAAPGQMATLTITMSDTSPSGYVSYPGIILTTSTPGISFFSDLGPPGALIDHTTSKPVAFTLSFDASIPSGTSAAFNARAYGWGHSAPDCPDAFVLAFSLTVR